MEIHLSPKTGASRSKSRVSVAKTGIATKRSGRLNTSVYVTPVDLDRNSTRLVLAVLHERLVFLLVDVSIHSAPLAAVLGLNPSTITSIGDRAVKKRAKQTSSTEQEEQRRHDEIETLRSMFAAVVTTLQGKASQPLFEVMVFPDEDRSETHQLRILEFIASAQHAIHACMYVFTPPREHGAH